MKLKTILHAHVIVSNLSASMADNFRDKVTREQYEVMKNNVYGIEENDKLSALYHGCGCGWMELDSKGQAVDLKYIDKDVLVVVEENDNEMAIIDSLESQEQYFENGQTEQNVVMLEFHTDQLMPYILKNGNIRLLVNLSCYELVRF